MLLELKLCFLILCLSPIVHMGTMWVVKGMGWVLDKIEFIWQKYLG